MNKKKINGAHLSKLPGSELIETKEYHVFNFDEKNRPIDPIEVAKWVDKFKNGMFFMKEFPGVIDHNFVVLDAQHRLKACEKLELPFYFRFTDEASIDNVTGFQTNSKWKPKDHLHSFVKRGYEHYITVDNFIERYHVPITTALMFLSGTNASMGPEGLGFYTGDFKVKNEAAAHKKLQAILDIKSLGSRIPLNRSFCSAATKVMSHKEYSHKRMLEQMTKYGTLLKRQVDTESYIKNLEEVYNYRRASENKLRFD